MYCGNIDKRNATRSSSNGESSITRCKFCHQAIEIEELKTLLGTVSSPRPPSEVPNNSETRLVAVETELEKTQQNFCSLQALMKNELEEVKKTTVSTLNRVNELQIQLDAELAKQLSLTNEGTGNRTNSSENQGKGNELLYSTVVGRRRKSGNSQDDFQELFKPYRNQTETRNRFEPLTDELDYEDSDEIIVIGDYNVNYASSNIRKNRNPLKLLGKPDLTIDEIEGIIQKENIPDQKPIIIQVGSKDMKFTETTMKKYKNMLTHLSQHQANAHVTGILPHPNQSRFKLSKILGLNERLKKLCDEKQIPFSDHWDEMIDARNYDFNKVNNKARINMQGSLTLENIFQNIGFKLISDLKSKNMNPKQTRPPDAQLKPELDQPKLVPIQAQEDPKPTNQEPTTATLAQVEPIEQEVPLPQTTATITELVTNANPTVTQSETEVPQDKIE